jgi:hypothetical protein
MCEISSGYYWPTKYSSTLYLKAHYSVQSSPFFFLTLLFNFTLSHWSQRQTTKENALLSNTGAQPFVFQLDIKSLVHRFFYQSLPCTYIYVAFYSLQL